MSSKDPKDMTAAELLRWAANGDPNEYGNTTTPHKLFTALGGKPYYNTTYDEDARNIRALADKIDAEIGAARTEGIGASLRQGAEQWAENNGWPCFRDGEDFGAWLKRCTVPRPLDEDGEPVQFFDYDIDWDETDECRNPGVLWEATAVDCNGNLLATAYSKIIAIAKTDDNGRVKRPAPDVLGADGLPVVEGETVWDTESGKELSVCAIANAAAGMIQCSDDTGYCEDYDARNLTHTPPDSQERIDEEALEDFSDYWNCGDAPCSCCPVKDSDGMTPEQRYNAPCCKDAQTLDLLRRQRELDARKDGVK